MAISIVIPCYNEAANIERQLQKLQPLRQAGVELILVDASSDNSAELAAPWVDKLLNSPAGRARQMNLGAKHASFSRLVFLHADTDLPSDALTLLQSVKAPCWGRFDLTVTGSHWLFPVITRLINLRARLTGVATGDQALFIDRALFDQVGGYAELPLMEDVAICKALRKISPPRHLPGPVLTSGRRWQKHGVYRTIVLMWRLRLLYWLGVPAERLAPQYRNHSEAQ